MGGGEYKAFTDEEPRVSNVVWVFESTLQWVRSNSHALRDPTENDPTENDQLIGQGKWVLLYNGLMAIIENKQ